ncbi:DUF4047 domain-containing protein [Rossellomorea aquimaris]|uniref:DUF4047 domain-containing protein n=1 Tax=Rossellomorea aquimaris TaxID=189382 RepID=UPI001CFF4860|nr:DUF4047 domain-containing protein [Rossellomorea aquimaris]
MTGRFGKLVIPGLLIMNLSLIAHLTGETEAAFISQKKVDAMTFSTAFVFPATIQQMEKEAGAEAAEINQLYEGYEKSDLEAALLLRERVVEHTDELYKIHSQLSHYHQQAMTNPEKFHFVIEGFTRVDKLMKEIEPEEKMTRLQSYIDRLREEVPKKEIESENQKNLSEITANSPNKGKEEEGGGSN